MTKKYRKNDRMARNSLKMRNKKLVQHDSTFHDIHFCIHAQRIRAKEKLNANVSSSGLYLFFFVHAVVHISVKSPYMCKTFLR